MRSGRSMVSSPSQGARPGLRLRRDGARHRHDESPTEVRPRPLVGPAHRPRTAPSWRPVGALVSPTLTEDGRTLVAGCDDGRVRWFDLATGRECGIALEAKVTGVGPQGAFVLGLDRGELRVWQAPGPLRSSAKDDAGRLRLNYISVDVRRDDGAVLVGQNDELATMGRILHLAVFSRGVGGWRGARSSTWPQDGRSLPRCSRAIGRRSSAATAAWSGLAGR